MALYAAPVRDLARGAADVAVLGPELAERRLDALVADGKLSSAVYERLLGTLSVIARGRESAVWDRDTATRRWRDLRRLGISLDVDGAEAQRQELLIGDVLAALVNAWRPVRGDR